VAGSMRAASGEGYCGREEDDGSSHGSVLASFSASPLWYLSSIYLFLVMEKIHVSFCLIFERPAK
jgi:hypothetical protein